MRPRAKGTFASSTGAAMRQLLRAQQGAAAVEFGLILPLLVMVVFGIIEFGTAYNRSQGMEAAVREGARFASAGTETTAAVRARVWNALQSNAGGSGFPEESHLQVRLYDGDGNLTGQSCDGSTDTVQVEAWVTGAIYDVTLVLVPSASMDFRTQATFRCLD